jgi:hypothetical protein
VINIEKKIPVLKVLSTLWAGQSGVQFLADEVFLFSTLFFLDLTPTQLYVP